MKYLLKAAQKGGWQNIEQICWLPRRLTSRLKIVNFGQNGSKFDMEVDVDHFNRFQSMGMNKTIKKSKIIAF